MSASIIENEFVDILEKHHYLTKINHILKYNNYSKFKIIEILDIDNNTLKYIKSYKNSKFTKSELIDLYDKLTDYTI